jgi:pimeloyl-ACP methyl ester carboxylesterase
MPLTSFANGRLFGARHGQGRPWVLALPGWQRTHRDFDALLDGLDAVALDLPGFGAAPAPPAAWSTSEYARWVAPVLDEMDDIVVILGHSFGGRVAVQMAAAQPQVGAQVLTGVPLTRPPGAQRRSPRSFRIARTLHRAHLVSERRMDRLRWKYGSADYRAAAGVLRGVLVKAVNEDYLDVLSAFPGPVELVWGAEDDQAPVAAADIAVRRCAQGRLTVVPGVGHVDAPRQAHRELRAALERHRPKLAVAE